MASQLSFDEEQFADMLGSDKEDFDLAEEVEELQTKQWRQQPTASATAATGTASQLQQQQQQQRQQQGKTIGKGDNAAAPSTAAAAATTTHQQQEKVQARKQQHVQAPDTEGRSTTTTTSHKKKKEKRKQKRRNLKKTSSNKAKEVAASAKRKKTKKLKQSNATDAMKRQAKTAAAATTVPPDDLDDALFSSIAGAKDLLKRGTTSTKITLSHTNNKSTVSKGSVTATQAYSDDMNDADEVDVDADQYSADFDRSLTEPHAAAGGAVHAAAEPAFDTDAGGDIDFDLSQEDALWKKREALPPPLPLHHALAGNTATASGSLPTTLAMAAAKKGASPSSSVRRRQEANTQQQQQQQQQIASTKSSVDKQIRGGTVVPVGGANRLNWLKFKEQRRKRAAAVAAGASRPRAASVPPRDADADDAKQTDSAALKEQQQREAAQSPAAADSYDISFGDDDAFGLGEHDRSVSVHASSSGGAARTDGFTSGGGANGGYTGSNLRRNVSARPSGRDAAPGRTFAAISPLAPSGSGSTATAAASVQQQADACAGTIDMWMTWLGIESDDPYYKELSTFAEMGLKDARSKLPADVSYMDGIYVNDRTGKRSKEHPRVKAYRKKVQDARDLLKCGLSLSDWINESMDESFMNESTMNDSIHVTTSNSGGSVEGGLKGAAKGQTQQPNTVPNARAATVPATEHASLRKEERRHADAAIHAFGHPRSRVSGFDADAIQRQVALIETLQQRERQYVDEIRELKADAELEKSKFRREKALLSEELQSTRDRLHATEEEREGRIAEALRGAEARARAETEHVAELNRISMEQQRAQAEQEIASLRAMHEREITTLRQHMTDGIFLKGLANRVDLASQSLGELQNRVSEDRSEKEIAVLDQIRVHQTLLREKERKIAADQARNADLLKTFENLRTEHDGEKARLAAEHERLAAMQHELKAETSVLREQLVAERERLLKDRALFESKRDLWHAKQKREIGALETKEATLKRAAAQAEADLEETRASRQDILRDLDAERNALCVRKRELDHRSVQLDAEYEALRLHDEQLKRQVCVVESRMNELTLLSARVQKQSEEVARARGEAIQDKRSAEQLRNSASALREEALRLREEHDGRARQLQQERLDFERKRLDTLRGLREGEQRLAEETATATLPSEDAGGRRVCDGLAAALRYDAHALYNGAQENNFAGANFTSTTAANGVAKRSDRHGRGAAMVEAAANGTAHGADIGRRALHITHLDGGSSGASLSSSQQAMGSAANAKALRLSQKLKRLEKQARGMRGYLREEGLYISGGLESHSRRSVQRRLSSGPLGRDTSLGVSVSSTSSRHSDLSDLGTLEALTSANVSARGAGGV